MSRFGGIPVDQDEEKKRGKGPRFGGIPLEEAPLQERDEEPEVEAAQAGGAGQFFRTVPLGAEQAASGMARGLAAEGHLALAQVEDRMGMGYSAGAKGKAQYLQDAQKLEELKALNAELPQDMTVRQLRGGVVMQPEAKPDASGFLTVTPGREQLQNLAEQTHERDQKARVQHARERWEKGLAKDFGELTKRLDKATQEKLGVSDEYLATLPGQIAHGAGGLPVYIASALTGVPGGVALQGALFDEAWQDYVETVPEEDFDPQQGFKAAATYAVAATALERIGLNSIIGQAFKGGAKMTLKDGLKAAAAAAATEGGTEAAQGFLQDAIASGAYDEDRELLTREAFEKRLREFTVGAILGAGGSAAASTPQLLQREPKSREQGPTREIKGLSEEENQLFAEAKRFEDLAEETQAILGAGGMKPADPAYRPELFEREETPFNLVSPEVKPPRFKGIPVEDTQEQLFDERGNPRPRPAFGEGEPLSAPVTPGGDGAKQVVETEESVKPIETPIEDPAKPAPVGDIKAIRRQQKAELKRREQEAKVQDVTVKAPGKRFSVGRPYDGSEDVLTIIEDNGGVMTQKVAETREGYEPASYERFEDVWGHGPQKNLRRADGGGQSPDQIAAMFRDSYPQYGIETRSDLEAALEDAPRKRQALKEALQREETQAKWEAFAYAGERSRGIRGKSEEPMIADDLYRGDTFTVGGSKVTVESVDPDGNVKLFSPRWGHQQVESGQLVWHDRQSYERAKERPVSGDAPFREAADRVANRSIASRRAIKRQLDTNAAKWWEGFERLAPGLVKDYQLQVGSILELGSTVHIPRERNAANIEAAWIASKKMVFLVDTMFTKRSDPLVMLTLQHELAHAHWDTLSETRKQQLEKLWEKETGQVEGIARHGPLYHKGQQRRGVAKGVETDVKEWYAERIAWNNHQYARRKLEIGNDGVLKVNDGIVGKAAQNLRMWLRKAMEFLADKLGLGEEVGSIDAAYRQFLDTGGKISDEAGPVDFAERVAYQSAPDGLMGFKRYGPQKTYHDTNYKTAITVKVTHGPGMETYDAIKGLNVPHAMERARRNWPDAEVEFYREGDQDIPETAYDRALKDLLKEDVSFSELEQASFAERELATADEGRTELERSTRWRTIRNRLKSKPLGRIGKAFKKSKPGKALKKYGTSAGNLPKQAFEALRSRNHRMNAALKQVEFTLEDFNRAVRDDVVGGLDTQMEMQINGHLAGREKLDPEQYPRLAPVLDRMRAQIDALSGRLISEGIIDGDLQAKVEGNLGFYLNRSYRKYDDKLWGQKVMNAKPGTELAKIKAEATNLIEGELRADLVKGHADAEWRQLHPDAKRIRRDRPDYKEIHERLQDNEDIQPEWKHVENKLWTLLNPDVTPEVYLGQRNAVKKDLGIFKKRKSIPPAIRRLWGEHTDARINYARSVMKTMQVLEAQRSLEKIKEAGMGTFLFENDYEVQGGAEKIAAERNSAMSPLDGLWTTPEIKEALIGATEPKADNVFLGLWYRLNGLVKLAKTVYSPVTQIRNHVANYTFMVANGHFDVKQAGKSFDVFAREFTGKRDTAKTRAYITRLMRLGVIGESVNANELREAFDDAFRQGQGEMDLGKFSERLAIRAAKWPARKAAQLYQLNDDIFKAYAFENERTRLGKAIDGLSEQQLDELAAARVRDTLPTYSMIPKAFQGIRRAGLTGSFLSFSVESMRTLYKAHELAVKDIRSGNPRLAKLGWRRLATLSLAQGFFYGAAWLSRALVGVDEEEDRKLRKFQPDYARNSHYLYLGKEPGKYRIMDLSYMDVWNWQHRMLNAVMYNEGPQKIAGEMFREFYSPVFGEGLVTKAVGEAFYNPGNKVRNEAGDFWDQAIDTAAYLGKAAEPGAVTTSRRISYGATGYVDPKTGRSYDLGDELTAAGTGARLQSLEIGRALEYKVRGYMAKSRAAARYFTEMNSDKAPAGAPELREAWQKANDAKLRHWQEMRELWLDAISIGTPPAHLIKALENSGLGKQEAQHLILGQYRPYMPSEINGVRLR